jgi:hypothetical protein
MGCSGGSSDRGRGSGGGGGRDRFSGQRRDAASDGQADALCEILEARIGSQALEERVVPQVQ